MRLLIIAMLIALLLFAGCINPKSQTDQHYQNMQDVQEKDNQQNQHQEQVNEQEQETNNQGVAETIAGLIAKGIPVECTYTVEDNGQIQTYKVYILGEKTRVDGSVNGMAYSMISINEDGKQVVYVKGNYQMEGCDWMKMSYESEEVENPAEDINYDYPVDTEVETTINGVRGTYECHPASFGEEKFVPNGQVCDLTDIYNQQYPS